MRSQPAAIRQCNPSGNRFSRFRQPAGQDLRSLDRRVRVVGDQDQQEAGVAGDHVGVPERVGRRLPDRARRSAASPGRRLPRRRGPRSRPTRRAAPPRRQPTRRTGRRRASWPRPGPAGPGSAAGRGRRPRRAPCRGRPPRLRRSRAAPPPCRSRGRRTAPRPRASARPPSAPTATDAIQSNARLARSTALSPVPPAVLFRRDTYALRLHQLAGGGGDVLGIDAGRGQQFSAAPGTRQIADTQMSQVQWL